MGRPAEFQHRVRLTVFLERRDLAAIQACAKVEGISTSRFARRVLLDTAAKRKGR